MRKFICIISAIIISTSVVGCTSHKGSKTNFSNSTNSSVSSSQLKESQLSTEETTEITEPQTEKQTETPTNPATEPPTEAPKTIDDYVTTYRSESINYTDDLGNHISYNFAIPQINLESVDAQTANSEIQEQGNNFIDGALECQSSKTSMICRNISYEAWLNDSILSVVFIVDLDLNSCSYYLTYNFDVNTGKLLNNSDIAQYLSCTEEELNSRIKTTIDNNYVKQDTSQFQSSMADFYYSEYNKSLSDENIEQAIVYLTDNGVPYVHYKEYIIAGAGEYEQIYPLDW